MAIQLPRFISRPQVIDACAALGLDANKIGRLEISRDCKWVGIELFDVLGTAELRMTPEMMAHSVRPVVVVEIPIKGDGDA